MASRDQKIVRRAQAMAELARLSDAVAKRFNLQAMETAITNKDHELAEIQRIESVNQLLNQVLQSMVKPEVERESKSVTKRKLAQEHGPN